VSNLCVTSVRVGTGRGSSPERVEVEAGPTVGRPVAVHPSVRRTGRSHGV